MELIAIPHYDERTQPGETRLSWPFELKRTDVVDKSSFLNALVSTTAAVFVDGRPSEPIVTATFAKGQGWATYSMPASEFMSIMKTQLCPMCYCE